MNVPVRHSISDHRISEMKSKFWSVVGLNVLNMKREILDRFLQEQNASVTVGFP
jgi:hypothetical protein